MKVLTTLATLLLLAPMASTQIYFEQFPVAGSPIAGWTQTAGTWTVTDLGASDTRAHHNGTGHAFLSSTNSAANMGVVEALVTGVSNTCNGGVFMQWDSGRQAAIRAYGASSGGQAQYAVLIFDAPGVSRSLVSLPTRTKNLVVRILTQGTEARAQFDVDPIDGQWDYELGITLLANNPTEYGIYSWNQSYGDDFKHFDAAIFRRSMFQGSNIGQSVPLDLYAPTANAPYGLIVSRSQAQLLLPNGWFLPVTPDDLTGAAPQLPTVFANFNGALDGNGEATAQLNVPNIPALAGFYVYISGAVVSGSNLIHLFNDERIDFAP